MNTKNLKTTKTSFKKLLAKTKAFASVKLQQLNQTISKAMNHMSEFISTLSTSQIAMFVNQLKLNASLLRVGILAFLLLGVPAVFVSPESCFADTTPPASGSTSVALEDVANNAFTTIYTKWRWPICGVLMLGAAVIYIVGGDRGKVVAAGVCVGILAWALVPYLRDTFKTWSGGDSGTVTATTKT